MLTLNRSYNVNTNKNKKILEKYSAAAGTIIIIGIRGI